MRRIVLVVMTILAGLAAQPAMAQGITGLEKGERADALRFALNNSLFTLYHEVGHLLIDRLALPVLGPEEATADNIATWMLLQRNTPDANLALEDAARGWMLTGDSYENVVSYDDSASGYLPDRQRSLQIICLMVGADGAAFGDIAERYAIPRDRQNSCFFDYDMLDRSLGRVLPEDPGEGTRVDVRYQQAGQRLRMVERAFRASGIFEQVADEVRQNYHIRSQVRFTAKSCDEPNAFYDPQLVEIIFCYELMQEFIDLHLGDLALGSEATSN